MEKDLRYWQENASENFMNTPISVLRYIGILENEGLRNAYKAGFEFAKQIIVDGVSDTFDEDDYIKSLRLKD